MNRLAVLILSFFLVNNCSFNENSGIWKDKQKALEDQKNIEKVFLDKELVTSEFNQELEIDLANIKTNNKIIDNKNNFGSQNYEGLFNKVGNYKFSKLENVNQLNFKPIFLDNGLIFFDKKGSIIRFDNSQKILWKKNHYSKTEKKLKPQLNFKLSDKDLLVVDSIAKYYSINIDSGEINWSKNSTYPFNSEIKKYKDKFFVVDYKNTLRCYYVDDGSECWNLQTEDSFTISNSKFSLIIIEDMVIFNNSIGDITAVDIETGMITWQLPTQSSSIINETYNFKISKLVSDNKSIYFSNNKNEFYSVDIKSGIINWINQVSAILTPVIINDYIFTVSDTGYLITIQKKEGNIIRVNDIYKNYDLKKRKKLTPTGFSIGQTNLYLSNSDGNIIVINLTSGNLSTIEKASRDLISRPYIYNGDLFVVKNGSVIQYD